MAQRLAFTALDSVVVSQIVNFESCSGFSIEEKQKSIEAMHNKLPGSALEISTKSPDELGRSLSAFNLRLDEKTLECVFQGSKVFQNGGPYTDMYDMKPQDAKRDPRRKNSGVLLAYEYAGVRWSLDPRTAFYDYLYARAVKQSINVEELKLLERYQFFTDIEFNHRKSTNTQARSIVLVKLLLEEYGEIPDFTPSEWIYWHVRHVGKI